MRHFLIVLGILVCSITSAVAQVSVGIGLPGLSIGINLPAYPRLVPVPGYPVYYAPQLDSNYFFYDGMYWVFLGDYWYTSTWYNGPWELVPPEAVPLFILRVPVRYYRRPPAYFRGWSSYAPPRWGEHWGHTWEQDRRGWDNWNRGAVPAAAPLPAYQRQYSGSRYPRPEQQQVLQSQNYRYRPQDAAVQQHYRVPEAQNAPRSSAPPTQGSTREGRSSRQDPRGPDGSSAQRGATVPPHGQWPQPAAGGVRSASPTTQPRQQGPTATEIQPPPPRARRESQQPQRQSEQPMQQPRQVQQQAQQPQTQQQQQQRQAQQAQQRQVQQQAQQRQAPQQQRQAQQQPQQAQRQVPQQQPQHETPARQRGTAQHEQQPASHGQEKNEPRGGEPGK